MEIIQDAISWISHNRKRLQYIVVMDTHVKFALLWLTFVIGSFSYDFCPLPQSYFSNKKNIFNTVFVKKGWGWTGIFLLGYIICIIIKQKINNICIIIRQISRLIVYTIEWYIFTEFFEYINKMTGKCLGSNTTDNITACVKGGFIWNGFDISGHTYILTLMTLIINHELNKTISLNIDIGSEEGSEQISKEYVILGTRIPKNVIDNLLEILSVSLVLLMILWEIMLFFTCAYFHTLVQKLLGILLGLLSFYIPNRYIFKNNHAWLPMPAGLLNQTKDADI